MRRLNNRFFSGLFLFLTLCSLNVKAERVRLLTPDDGLSNSHINQIFQDDKGYIWIATENGLNKFNGYDFEVFLSDPNDSTSIRANYVLYVFEDSRGLFWVATSNGLLQYDRTKNVFFHWDMGEKHEEYKNRRVNYILEDRNHHLWISFPGNGLVRLDAETLAPVVFDSLNSEIGNHTVFCILEDRKGNLWFGTEYDGIYVFNPNNQTTKHFYHDPAQLSGLSSNRIFAICENGAGEIWVGTIGGGINIFDQQTESFRSVKSDNYSMENMISSLFLDKDQTIWVGTDGAGIFRYDNLGNRTSYWEEASAVCDLRTAKVHDIFQDKQGNFWIALYQKGVLYISASGAYFQNIGFNPFDLSKNIGTHCVISIVEDHQGNVWAGTDGNGLYRIQPSGKIDHFTHENTSGFPENVITALFEDKDHDIWIGTYLNGFFRYHPHSGKFDAHYQKSDNGLSDNHVTVFTQDYEGNLWIGTNGGGISLFNPQTHQFKSYLYHADYLKEQISSNWVFDIIIDRNKEIWAATSNGLNRLNKETDKFETLDQDIENRNISNLMYTLLEDYKGNIWVGGFYGLHCLDRTTGKMSLITSVDGLPDNMIAGIEEDREHVLWISTGKGLSRYNPNTGEFMNFFAEDGIQSNEFRRGSRHKGKNDKMFFGGINGITTFYPSQISQANQLLELVFTDLLVNNVLVKVGQSDILLKSLDDTERIRLTYNQRSFTFQFAALEYGTPLRVNYLAQLENFDTQWRQVSSRNRSVSYTNLNPGNYIFQVQATIDGKHVLQKDMHVEILPPWWLTLPAKLAYGMFVALLLYGFYVYLSFRQLERHRAQLEHLVEQRTVELLLAKDKAEESDNLKSAFLANMSHEIRTPLNGIVGFLQFINSDDLTSERRQEYMNVVNNSANQLVGIINDIIDVSKIEAKQMSISPVPVNLNELMNELWVFFNAYLQSSNKERVVLVLDDSEFLDHCVIYTDSLRLRQIINNLISNAVKFTEKGFIRFGYRKSEAGFLEFVVEDSGIGMHQDHLELIFERFRQAEIGNDRRRLYGGTGLGLTISRSLVQLVGGTMWVESTEGLGSSFYFTVAYLPVAPQDIPLFDTNILALSEKKPFTGKSVLLVQPNHLKFDYYEKLIAATGAIVFKVENLQQCYNFILQPDQVNLVIVDAVLFNKEGFSMMRNIKKEREKLPIALIISEKKEKYLPLLRNNLCKTAIQIPIEYADILRIMEDHIN